MIIVRITSGLGNQMYQYNFYKFIKELYPDVTVKADVTWFYANDEHHGYELERVFGGKSKKKANQDTGFEIDVASTKEIYKVTGQIPNFCNNSLGRTCQYLLGPVNRILREKFHTTKDVNVIDRLESDRKDSFYEDVTSLDVSKDWYLFGFWIEEEYYRDRIDRLRKELVFPDFEDDSGRGQKVAADSRKETENSFKESEKSPQQLNIEIAGRMKATNSVSIHVRRGDYLSQTYASSFLTLGREYYEAAVKAIKDRVENPEFFIFSDDADFVNKEFTWLDNKTIVTHNTGNNSFRDMQLMSLCKHNIIANSTFSQWGTLLNQSEGKITVYPSTYMVDEDTEVKTMDGWVRI